MVLCTFEEAISSFRSWRLAIGFLLSTELIASVVICGALFMAIRTILGFTRDIEDLRPKLFKIENTLERIRTVMKDNKERVGILSVEVAPIEDLEGRMRSHYEAMQELELAAEKRKIAEEENEQSGRSHRIKRTRMGFGADDADELD